MSELSKLAAQHNAAETDTGGVLGDLLRDHPKLQHGLTEMLVNLRSKVDAGVSYIKGEPQTQPTAAVETKADAHTTPRPRMGEVNAAIAGLSPITAAIHGGYVGGAGQAARSGGRSLLEGLAAQQLGSLISKGHTPTKLLAGTIGASHGAYAAARNFNERSGS
jgi:hypothetical protein